MISEIKRIHLGARKSEFGQRSAYEEYLEKAGKDANSKSLLGYYGTTNKDMITQRISLSTINLLNRVKSKRGNPISLRPSWRNQ